MASYNLVVVITLAIVFLKYSCSAQLCTSYYDENCPQLFNIVRGVVKNAIANESRMGASLLRLHFHDCFVDGCDASVLLDDTPSVRGEKSSIPNNNSARGFDVIERIKTAVEEECPGIVSCADILAIAARDSVCILGGPSWDVPLGRKDSNTSNFTAANTGAIPGPAFNLTNLTSNFANHNLSVKDLVALSGAHTIGLARCTTFRARLNESNIDDKFAKERRTNCLNSSKYDNNLAPLDSTPIQFDNEYYLDLIANRGLLHSDQQLFTSGGKNDDTHKLVISYSNNQNVFFDDFVKSMIKMSKIGVLTGTQGGIRTNCTRVN